MNLKEAIKKLKKNKDLMSKYELTNCAEIEDWKTEQTIRALEIVINFVEKSIELDNMVLERSNK